MAGEKIKVLVVDDEKIVRDFFIRLLSLLGLDVLEAEDGHKAIEMAGQEKFDLFFVDMRMPGLNGLETFREIKKLSPEAVVVMMTGYAVDDIIAQAKAEGAHSAIRKPFDISEIKEVIQRCQNKEVKKTLNVLIVDDDEVILNFFSSFLKNKDVTYKVASDKEKSLALVKAEKFDLIFLDLVLVGTSGVEVYQEIKKVFSEANIVLMTGHRERVQEVSKEIDLAGCLYKPFEIESILGYIEQVKKKKNA